MTAPDALRVFHFAIAAGITLGLVLIPLGGRLGWAWVRRRGLRLAHLAAIAWVAIEAVLGIACPLTVWEDALRGEPSGGEGFIARWVGWLLYWQAPGWVFTLAYLTAAAWTAWLWWRVPPVPGERGTSRR